MKKITPLIFLFLLLSGWIMSSPVAGQQVGKWWMNSSRLDTMRNKILVHASAKYSFTNMSGVLTGQTHTGDVSLTERKKYFTNNSAFGVDKMNLNLKSATPLIYNTTSYYFTDYLDYDFSKVIFGQVGFIWERDDILLLKNRYSTYAGLGVNIVLFKKFNLRSLVATGRINQDYMISVDNIDVIKEPYTAFYCKNKYSFAISSNVMLAGQFYYFSDLDAKDRYRYGTSCNLVVGLAPHLNLMVGFNYRYDRELVRLGLRPDNSMQNVGIEISL